MDIENINTMEEYKYNKNDGIVKNLYKFTMINYAYIIIQLLAVVIINAYTDKNIALSLFTIIFVQFWSYISHIFSHSQYILNFMKLHHFHHKPEISNQPYYVCIELYANLIFSGGIILIILNLFNQRYFGTQYKFFNYYIILLWSFIYSSYHLINYHFLDIETHINHHKYEGTTNFAPDWWDIIFETKREKDAIENANSSIINVIISTIVVLLLKWSQYDPISGLYNLIIKTNGLKISCNDTCNVKLI